MAAPATTVPIPMNQQGVKQKSCVPPIQGTEALMNVFFRILPRQKEHCLRVYTASKDGALYAQASIDYFCNSGKNKKAVKILQHK